MKEYNMRRHYETMHRDQYDAYQGNVRKEKLKQLKSAYCKQRSFFTNTNQSNEDCVKASFVLSEMIAKSSQPFTEGLFIKELKECLVKTSDICADKKKLFEGISLSPNIGSQI